MGRLSNHPLRRLVATGSIALGAIALWGLALSSCQATEPAPLPVVEHSLPATWDTTGVWDFEVLVSDLDERPWSTSDREVLAAALRDPGPRSIRAAVLLSWGEAASYESLFEHLEARTPEPDRHGDAAEIVAAAALGRRLVPGRAERLAALAIGDEPHPDLEVRVECAASALDLGAAEVTPFLLKVLHAGTPAELTDPIDWPPTDTLAWSKSRAAEALSRYTGLPNRFRPDGPFEHQMAESERFEEAVSARSPRPM